MLDTRYSILDFSDFANASIFAALPPSLCYGGQDAGQVAGQALRQAQGRQDRIRENDRKLRSGERFFDLLVEHTQLYVDSAKHPIDVVQGMDRFVMALIH